MAATIINKKVKQQHKSKSEIRKLIEEAEE